jgi:hypothetical protein
MSRMHTYASLLCDKCAEVGRKLNTKDGEDGDTAVLWNPVIDTCGGGQVKSSQVR